MRRAYRDTLLCCVVLFVVALCSRLAYLKYFGIETPHDDATEYIAVARHLAGGLGFTEDGLTPSTYRPPLFSWLLGAWCYLLGNSSLRALAAFQTLMQSLSAPLTYLLLRQIGQRQRWALAGGLYLATYPFLVSTVGMILQEPTQMLMALLIAIAIVAWCREPTFGKAALAGLLFGLGAFAKAPFLAVPVAIVPASLCSKTMRRQLPIPQVTLACAIVAAVVLPWTYRNFRVSGGHVILINSQNVTYPVWLVADCNFIPRQSLSEPPFESPPARSGAALTYGNQDGIDYLNRRNHELLSQGVTGQDLWEALAASSNVYLHQHPLYMLRITLRGLVLLFSPATSSGLARFFVARIAAMVLLHLPLAVGLLIGAARSVREKNAAIAVLALSATMYLLAHAPGVVGDGRYSTPFLPVLLTIGSYGVWGDPSRSVFSRTARSLVAKSSGQRSSVLSNRVIQGHQLSG